MLAAVVLLLQPVPVYAASGQVRMSQTLEEKEQQAIDAEISRANEESMNRVAINLGRLDSSTIDLSHYINKKLITKGELEAFKWSFIFSQFARPFQDSLDDVFNQSVFQQMESNDTMISSVASVLGASEYISITDADGLMLSSANYKELSKQIKNNLYYNTLYTADGAPVVLNDLLSDKFNANTVFYIYDRVENMGFSDQEMLELYYNQGKLANGGSQYDFQCEEVMIPVLPYNSSTFLYLQLAVGSYCRQAGIDLGTLRSTKGGGTLYMDSYGNTCVYDGEDFKIIIPNFGNPIFINEATSGTDLDERVFFYNKWISTCYSKKLRPSNDPQPLDSNGFPSVFVLGDNDPIEVDNSDKEGSEEEDQTSTTLPAAYGDGASFYLSEFLNTSQTSASKQDKYGEDSSNMKDSLVLVDPPTLSGFVAVRPDWTLGPNWGAQMIPQQNIQDRVQWLVNKGYGTLDYSFGTFNGDDFWGDYGTLASPASDGRIGFAGDSSNTDKFPLVQADRELSDAEGDNYWSVVKAFSRITSNRSFSFGESGILSFNQNVAPVVTQGSTTLTGSNPAYEIVSAINDCYAIFFAFDYNKTIDNQAYIAKAGTSDSTWAAMMFIDDDIIDYGQDMNIYMEGTEKGMYLPEYRLFFTGNTEALLENLYNGVDRLKSAATDGSWTVVADPNGGSAASKLEFSFQSLAVPDTKYTSQQTGETFTISQSAGLKTRLSTLKDILDAELHETGMWWWKSWDAENSYQNAFSYLGQICNVVGLNPSEVMRAALTMSDDTFEGSKNFYLPQWYLVARDNRYSSEMGCNTIDDFVLSTYFWDRYYLTKTPMNREFFSLIYNESQDIIEKYNPHTIDWSTCPGAVVKTDAEGNTVRDADGRPVIDTSACSEYDLQNTYYRSLNSGDIVLYQRSGESTDYSLRLHWAVMDSLWDLGLDAFGDPSNRYIDVNYYDLIMALQKNTDYEHNYQVLPVQSTSDVEHVSLETLMDDAYLMLTNPVRALTTILTGMLYDLHRLFGTGTLGSSFDLNWLLTNKLYLAVSEWYVVGLMTIICVMSFIKVVQYAFIQRLGMLNILKRIVAGVLLACMPLVLFRGFVWVFSFSSQQVLEESLYKTILSQVQMKQLEKVNADANVDTELSMFREQFEGIESKYDGLTFNCVDYYDYATRELVYKDVSLTEMLEKTKLTWDKEFWYDYRGFTPVNQEYYDESLFYFFYDYLKSMYLRYYATNIEAETSAMRVIALKYNFGDSNLATLDDTQRKDLQTLEQNFAQTTGNFRAMMHDSLYVYGASALKENQGIYGKPRVKDLVGFYKIFQDPTTAYSQPGISGILDSEYYIWMKQQPAMAYNHTVPAGVDVSSNKTWTNPGLISNYTGRDWIYTSYLDLFNPDINLDYDSTYATYNINTPKVTPFEETLFAMNEEIYDKMLEVLDYCPTQISDEAAIATCALIATFVVDEHFNMEPTLPLMGSVNMDTILRCALIKSSANMDSGINLMYAMLNEGYGFFAVVAVILMEMASAALMALRILLICIVLVGSTIWAAWRFLTTEPRKCKKLMYGVVGNFVAIVALHYASVCMTNFIILGMSALGTSVIGSILLILLLWLGYAALSVMHFGLIYWIVKNPFDLGGHYIHDAVETVQHMSMEAIHNLSAKVHHQSAEAQEVQQDIQEAQVNVESEAANVENVDAMQVSQINRVSSAMSDAEAKSSEAKHLWDGTVDTLNVDKLLFNQGGVVTGDDSQSADTPQFKDMDRPGLPSGQPTSPADPSAPIDVDFKEV